MRSRSIFVIVNEKLGAAAADALAKSLKLHYHFWKFQRWSDQASLSVAKHVLCEIGFAKVCRNPEWIINRGEKENLAAFGTNFLARSGKLEQARTKRLKGTENPYDELRNLDSGPGNGTALYEGVTPGWQGSGLGPELLYSIEGTLQNCLRPEIQGDMDGFTPSYVSKLFHKAAKSLEVLSVAEFVSSGNSGLHCDEVFAEWDSLGEAAAATSLLQILKNVDVAGKIETADPQRVAKGIVLGFLIDELEGRLQCPNGMNFSVGILCYYLAQAPQALVFAKHIAESLGHDVEKLASAAVQFQQMAQERFTRDFPLRPRLSDSDLNEIEKTADSFREVAFAALDKMDEAPRQTLFAIANELWRWTFFERDAIHWTSPDEKVDTIDLILRWLRRPWGILRADEMDMLLRDLFGNDEPDDQPGAMFFLADFLRHDVEPALAGIFEGTLDAAAGMEALRRLIQRRASLAEKRRAVTSVRVDDPAAMRELTNAQTLIQTFGVWAQTEKEIMDQIDARPQMLATFFGNGDWSRSVMSSLPTLSRSQLNNLQKFSGAPAEYVARYFDFTELEENPYLVLDCYPPENFEVINFE